MQATPTPHDRGTPLRGLIVDDQHIVFERVRRLLPASSYALTHAETLIDAYRELGLEHVDFVLLDLNLGDESGLKLLEWMQRRRIDIPVVVLTADERVDTAVNAIRAGAVDFVAKSSGLGDLAVRVERAIGLAAERRARARADEIANKAFEVADKGLVVLDALGRVERFNTVAVELLKPFGHLAEQRPIHELVSELPHFWEPAAMIADCDVWTTRMVSEAGAVVLRFSWRPLNGGDDGWLLVVEDTTAAERSLQAQMDEVRFGMLHRFSRALSHRLNNLVGAIRLHAELLREDLEIGGDLRLARRLVDNILDASDRTLGWVRQMRSYTPGEPILRQRLTTTELRERLYECLHALLQRPLPVEPCAGTADLEVPSGEIVLGLLQLLTERWIRLTEAPPRRICIGTSSEGRQRIQVRVIWQAHGLPPDINEWLIPDAIEIGNDTDPLRWIAYLRSHGGEVYVGGDTQNVHLDLTLALQDNSVVRTPAGLPLAKSESRALEGVRVALIEDEATLAEAIGYELEQHGAVVRHFTTLAGTRGDAFLDEADLWILDQFLPDGNGLELVHSRQHLPAILLVSGAEPRIDIAPPNFRFLRKPFTRTEFWHALNSVLGDESGRNQA